MADESPDAVERRTQEWLDVMMEPGLSANSLDHNLVYAADGTPRRVSRIHFGRLRRKLKIFRWLDRLELASFIDLASGWEHYPYLVRQRYGIDAAYYSDMVHRVNLPIDGPVFGKLDHAVTLRLPRLPFPDQAFDVVVCTEVLEHLVRPVESLAELWRITRRHLIITSLEALSLSRWQRRLAHLRVDTRQPHVERNFFERAELEALFGADVVLENLQYVPNEPVNPFASVAEQEAEVARLTDVDALAAALCRAVSHPEHGRGAFGMLLVKSRPGAVVRPPAPDNDAQLARWLIEQAAAEERTVRELFAVAAAWAQGTVPYPHEEAEQLKARPVAPSLVERLRCPDCRGELTPQGRDLRCSVCAHMYASEYGVPILHASTAADAVDGATALDLLCGSDGARRRVVDGLMRRLRRNEQPPGVARRLFWWIDRHVRAAAG
jgi:SAM-dependent methyltransferase